jgi:hypothetical protein
MTGLIVTTNLHGGRIIGDDEVNYMFAWFRSNLNPCDVGHGSPVAFSIIEIKGHPEAIRVVQDHERFNQPAPKQKRKVRPCPTS